MAEVRKIIKVFLASPGDLKEERKAAKIVIDEFNSEWSAEIGYQVELVGWELTVSEFGRAQAIINRDLEGCELFVGMMWKHWGTSTGAYTSGFEEEFEESVKRREREGRPEISMFFKDIESDFLRDPGDSLKKVIAFKEKLETGHNILFQTFGNTRDFESKFRRAVTTYVLKLRKQDTEDRTDQRQSTQAGGSDQIPKSDQSTGSPFSPEGAAFLRDFITRTEGNLNESPLTGAEVARFRLLSTIVKADGNDEHVLAVHDANILFATYTSTSFGDRELGGLLVSGLEHYQQENVPLWHWYAKQNGFKRSLLSVYAVTEPSVQARIGALQAMRLISEPLASIRDVPRSAFIKQWLTKDTPGGVKVAALGYLDDLGRPADLDLIKEELDNRDSNTTSAAIDAIVRIKLRDSRELALVALNELQPANVSQDILNTLFENSAALNTATLLGAIVHKDADVRLRSTEILASRNALTEEIAQRLLDDSSAKVRFAALKAFLQPGRNFTVDEAKKALVKPQQNYSLLFGGSDIAGEKCWKQFRNERFERMTNRELEEAASGWSVYDPDAYFALVRREFPSRGNDLRQSVADRYNSEFLKHIKYIEHIESLAEEADGLVENTKRVEKSVRENLTREALDVICERGDCGDLGLVREVLKDDSIAFSHDVVEYLRRFGEWDDILLIIASLERHRLGLSLLMPDVTPYAAAAHAIYAMGRQRLAELLAMPAPAPLTTLLIVVASDTMFRGLSNEAIATLFQSESATIRKSTALKCVRALPKARITKLLEAHVSGDGRLYYNVIHWLDLGVSAPKDLGKAAAEKAIRKEWPVSAV
jgi:hypothetical protein